MIRRFAPPADINTTIQFFTDLVNYLRGLRAAAYRGEGVTDVVFDSLTELGTIYTWAYDLVRSPNDQWETYREWKKAFVTVMQLLNAHELRANVFTIGHVAEYRKPGRTKSGVEVKGDPDWMADFKYHPAVEGWARYKIGHYLDFVVYMEEDKKTEVSGGKKIIVPVYKSYWLADSDVRVKNKLAHRWTAAGYPPVLESVDWPTVESMIQKLQENR